MTTYTQAGGATVTFELKDFSTYHPKSFTKSRMIDVASMPEGRVIDVTRHEQQVAGVGSYAQYLASWHDQGVRWVDTPEGKQWKDATIRQVLDELVKQSNEFADVRLITSFTVIARLGKEARTYRAAFFWKGEPGSGQRRFVAVDHVTQDMDQVAAERVAPQLQSQAPVTPGKAVNLASKTCVAETRIVSHSPSLSDSTNHILGQHSSSANVDFTCTCDTSCTSSCTAAMSNQSCGDSFGSLTVDACHNAGSSSLAGSATNMNGDSSPASCAAGYGCILKSCLFCLCSVGVTVNISGVSVSFSSSTTADYQLNLPDQTSCFTCTVQPSCTPCANQQCGYDTNCNSGQWCGGCGAGQQCIGGTCVQTCTPCAGQQCGYDMNCNSGQYCGSCGPNEQCSAGTCVSTCTPCAGQTCGYDQVCGSGQYCGSCPTDWTCNAYGNCEQITTSICGDGICDAGEDCTYCPQDCGPCNPDPELWY